MALRLDPERLAEWREELDVLDSLVLSFSVDLCFADLTNVAWLDEADLRLTLDLSSLCDRDRETFEEAALPELSSRESFPGAEERRLSPDISVSGGVGGLDDFFDVEPFLDTSSAFRLRSSSPPSVGSGVRGFSVLVGDKSSLLMTASLLCALLNDGYGNDTRLPASVDFEGDPSLPAPTSLLPSFSLLLLRCFLDEDDTSDPSPPSPATLLRDDLEDR